MFISSSLIAAAALTMQPDPTRAPREAFTGCLHAFVTSSVRARKATEAFESELPQQCQAEERAYREAVVRAEVAARSSRAAAEELAAAEIDDARRNSRESFLPPN